MPRPFHLGKVETPQIDYKTAMAPPSDIVPQEAYTHIRRAQELLRARDLDGARREADAALALPISDFVARNALGSVLYEVDNLDAARAQFQNALAENPRYADALNNLANVLARQGKPRAALEFYERALAESPHNADYLANLGGVRQALGDVSGALKNFEAALTADPTHADARWNRALAQLLTGDLAAGFADYEARWSLPEFVRRDLAGPLWRGEDVRGKIILVHSEQGYGDTIQMVRFAKILMARGARVLVETHAALAPIVRIVDGVAEVIVHGAGVPAFDLHVPMMSLPGLCGLARVADIPSAARYMSAPNGPSVALPPRRGQERRVGLVWSGRPTHKNDRNRSLGAGLLSPFAALPCVRLFSLQIGAAGDDLACLPGIVDLAPHLSDFGVTARILDDLDLIVTVDTAIAHLAGALGKPCWVMLPFAPDWRWLLGRDTSPWYPSLRLYRQPKLDDWASVIERIATDLAA